MNLTDEQVKFLNGHLALGGIIDLAAVEYAHEHEEVKDLIRHVDERMKQITQAARVKEWTTPGASCRWDRSGLPF